MRCLNSGCVDYTETRNNYCGRYADVTECDEMEPRNLAKPNAQPALSDGEILKDIRRLCEIIINNRTNVGDEAESLAMCIAHYPDILNAK